MTTTVHTQHILSTSLRDSPRAHTEHSDSPLPTPAHRVGLWATWGSHLITHVVRRFGCHAIDGKGVSMPKKRRRPVVIKLQKASDKARERDEVDHHSSPTATSSSTCSSPSVLSTLALGQVLIKCLQQTDLLPRDFPAQFRFSKIAPISPGDDGSVGGAGWKRCNALPEDLIKKCRQTPFLYSTTYQFSQALISLRSRRSVAVLRVGEEWLLRHRKAKVGRQCDVLNVLMC